jgi:hypothetical protein
VKVAEISSLATMPLRAPSRALNGAPYVVAASAAVTESSAGVIVSTPAIEVTT